MNRSVSRASVAAAVIALLFGTVSGARVPPPVSERTLARKTTDG